MRLVSQEKLIGLSDRLLPAKYFLEQVPGKIEASLPGTPTVQKILCSEKGSAGLSEADSGRSAWKKFLWARQGKKYCGLEYKGIGFKGAPIEFFPEHEVAVGGLALKTALKEYEYSLQAFSKGVRCQLPVACYSTEREFIGLREGVFVRSFYSPLRLSTFYFHGGMREYLELRYKSYSINRFEEYVGFIADSTTEAFKLMRSLGMVHGSLYYGNLSSEGEVADFEPAISDNQGIHFSKAFKDLVDALEKPLEGMKEFCAGITTENPGLGYEEKELSECFKLFYARFVEGLLGENAGIVFSTPLKTAERIAEKLAC